MRRLSLGQDIDADHIAATYQNGVLTVTLPMAERAKPRRIQVTPGAQLIEPSDSSDRTPRPNLSSPDGVQAGHTAKKTAAKK